MYEIIFIKEKCHCFSKIKQHIEEIQKNLLTYIRKKQGNEKM